MQSQKDGAHDLLQRLEDDLDAFSPVERIIANFILTNRGGIAFEHGPRPAGKPDATRATNAAGPAVLRRCCGYAVWRVSMAPGAGLEPATSRLTADCSTS